MSEAVAVQIVASAAVAFTALLAFLGTVLTVFGTRLSRRVKAIQVQAGEIRGQVQNDHDSNLREDLDAKHDDNKGILLTIQRDVAWLLRRQIATDDRLDDLEDTQGRKVNERFQAPDEGGGTRRERRERRLAYVPQPRAD